MCVCLTFRDNFLLWLITPDFSHRRAEYLHGERAEVTVMTATVGLARTQILVWPYTVNKSMQSSSLF